jgi:hypothetical protein
MGCQELGISYQERWHPKVYDVFSRDGRDQQMVIQINDAADMVQGICIVPASFCRIGEVDDFVVGRCEFVRKGNATELPDISYGEYTDVK